MNRVAAGEVVERPAAAVKELVENALDAGAASVAVELERAGKGLIRIADDGAGMGRDELLLALERHATSKIASVGDLAHVATFGFRGEALPSIAAVSRLVIETRERGAPEGTRLEADGGRVLRVAPCGCPEGTRVEVRDLFRTVPARLKFLRTDATELARCLDVVSRLAFACPGVGFHLRHGDRGLLRLPAAADAGARLRAHLGEAPFSGLIPVRGARASVAVAGFVSRPGAAHPGPEHQQFFVNGRPVRDSLLAQGVRAACRDHFAPEPSGAAWYLWVELPPGAVDVNVHPTKREVRFRDLTAVRDVIGDALREALRADRAAAIPVAWRQAPSTGADSRMGGARTAAESHPDARYAAESAPAQSLIPFAPGAAFPAAARSGAAPAALRLDARAGEPPAPPAPGQLFGTYLLCPGPQGLVIVDQHAAHERVLYERFLARASGAPSQQLLEPLLIELSAAEESILASLQTELESVGVALAPFGPRTCRVTALPPELPAQDAPAFVREMASSLLEESARPRVGEHRSRAAAVLACHAAIRANRRLRPAEAAALLADLTRCENPGACPHGRPTTITIDRAEIERRFKRT